MGSIRPNCYRQSVPCPSPTISATVNWPVAEFDFVDVDIAGWTPSPLEAERRHWRRTEIELFKICAHPPLAEGGTGRVAMGAE